MTSGNGSEWLCVRIYPGRFDLMDMVVTSAVAPAFHEAAAWAASEGMFFLRFVDERGPHIRLRFRGSAVGMNSLEGKIERILEGALVGLPRCGQPSMRHLIPWNFTASSLGEPAFEWALYEPELEKYGGPEGVAVAERVFFASSTLALGVLGGPAREISTRATLALVVMESSVAGLGLQPASFWQRYVYYWSGGSTPGAAEFRTRFSEAARRRRDYTREQCRAFRANPEAMARLAPYLRSLRRGLSSATNEAMLVSIEDLAFNHIHLTNNRLGFLPLEEAYLATFLLEPGILGHDSSSGAISTPNSSSL